MIRPPRRRFPLIRLSAALVILLIAGCGPRVPLAQRLERDLLVRQRNALIRELERTDEDFDSDVVVVVPASLIEALLAVALPVEAIVDERFRITANRGEVDFEGGLALVKLYGEVAAADREDVAVRIEIVGTLQVLDIQESGTLASRIEILGWQTQDVQVGGLSPPAGRLLDELASRPADDLNELLSRIEIPVSLLPTIPLPEVNEAELTIPSVDIPVEARLSDVRVGGGRLWVHVDVGVPGPRP